MTPEMIMAVLGAGGLSVIIPKLVDGLRAWQTGKAAEEKAQNRSALGRLVQAEARADSEAAYRRVLEEYASGLRRMLIQMGVPESKIPEWPNRRKDTVNS